MTPSAFACHDHAACTRQTLARAERSVRNAGARLTPVRRAALQVLLSEHRVFGAYDVLGRLAEAGFARQPPVAYRALAFLVAQGLAHRVRRLSGFAACVCPGEAHAPMFLICESCHAAAETPAPAVRAAMAQAAQGLGFTIRRASVEAVGLCPACAA